MVEILKLDNPFYVEAKIKFNDEQENKRKQVDDEDEDNEESDFETFDFDESDSSSLNGTNNNSKSKSNNGQESNAESMPIITNTTLNIIRLFGKYIHMLSILKIISTNLFKK